MTDHCRIPSRGRDLRPAVLATAFVILGLTACSPDDHAPGQPIVATVGSSSISKESFDRLLDLSRQPQPFGNMPPEALPSPKDILAELVKEVLLGHEIEDRGLSVASESSFRDTLAEALTREFDPTTEELEQWFEANKHSFSRSAQLRFLNVPVPNGAENRTEKLTNREFFALCEAADTDAGGFRRWGDIGWHRTSHALWWPRHQWGPEVVGQDRRQHWPEGHSSLIRAMHYRPPAQYAFKQVIDSCRLLMTEDFIQSEIRRILMRRARTTAIAIIDETLDFDLDPASIARTEPGPALETLDPSLDDTAGMQWIDGGTFTTGSTDAEIDERVQICKQYVEPALGEGSCARWKYEDEIRRQVTIGSLFMDRTEVSWEDYQVFVEAARHRPLPRDWSGTPGFPVANVSLEDAQSYCRWRGKRLPTADEWEFAARGSEGRRYPWGNESPDGTRANFCDTNCPKAWHNFDHDDGFAGPAPVGSFPAGATPEGLLDMGGNVREWTATVEGDHADVKGGGFFNAIDDMIAADVRRNLIEVRDPTIGFRCAQDARTNDTGERQ